MLTNFICCNLHFVCFLSVFFAACCNCKAVAYKLWTIMLAQNIFSEYLLLNKVIPFSLLLHLSSIPLRSRLRPPLSLKGSPLYLDGGTVRSFSEVRCRAPAENAFLCVFLLNNA